MQDANIFEIRERLYKIIKEYKEDLDESQMDDLYLLQNEDGLNSLSMTSIELIEFIVSVEEEFEIEINNITSLEKIHDVIDYIYYKDENI